jgi:type II secretory pathway component GspD/PulD (secretin)
MSAWRIPWFRGCCLALLAALTLTPPIASAAAAPASGMAASNFRLNYIRADEAGRILRQLLSGTKFTLTIDETKNTLLFHGPRDKRKEAEDIIRRIDAAGPPRCDSPILKVVRLECIEPNQILEKTLRWAFNDKITRISACRKQRIVLVYAIPETADTVWRVLTALDKLAKKKKLEKQGVP